MRYTSNVVKGGEEGGGGESVDLAQTHVEILIRFHGVHAGRWNHV